jgi:predicted ferric reductase
MKLAAVRGPFVLVVICAIPLVLWLRAAPVSPRFSTSTLALTSTAVLCAFAGVSAFAMNLVLGARIRPVEKLFGGLERMYRIHRQNGQIAFALLAAHAFLIFASRVTVSVSSGFDLVTPRAGLTVFCGFVALTLMGIALVLTLFVRLGQEVFVYVQRSFGFVFLLASYHVFATQNGAKALSSALNWYTVALATAGIAAFAYRSLFHNVLVHRKHYTVEAANRLDEFVTEVVLEPRSKPLVYKPGQFVFVNFRSQAMRAHQRAVDISLERQVFSIRAGEIGNQFHPFSITSAPAEQNLRITVKAVGDYTSALRRLEPGAEAVVEGPFGSFSNEGLSQDMQLWIAGGIGVTPFLSMARSLGETPGGHVHFYYCIERLEEAHSSTSSVRSRRGARASRSRLCRATPTGS